MSFGTHSQAVTSDYREFPVPRPLADHFLCLWTQTIVGSQGDYAHRVLPDGCVDIVFINGDTPLVVGPWVDPFIVRLAVGTTIVGARFHPGRASGALGVPASKLVNASVPLLTIWDKTKTARLARISEEPSVALRRAALSKALIFALKSAAPLDSTIMAAIRWLAQQPHGTIEQLSRWIGISNRHLQRRFSAAVGYSPKMFQSVLRFQCLLNLVDGKRGRQPLAELGANAGYADQAHMTREVQRFAACRASVLLPSAKSTLRMSDLFKTHNLSPNYP
jgi:AraC-like DNA-binding protein